MEKTLVYHLYVNSADINEKPLYKLHRECLNIYKDRFDKALFVVTVDDLTNTELIGNAIKWVLNINFGKEFDIKVEKNDALCESKTFQKYVLDNTNLNGMVFLHIIRAVIILKAQTLTLLRIASLYGLAVCIIII